MLSSVGAVTGEEPAASAGLRARQGRAVEPWSRPVLPQCRLLCPVRVLFHRGEEKELESGKTSESTTVLKVPALRPFPRGPHREPRVEFKDPGAGGGEERP